MSQAILPNSIDAGTEIVAAELQGNFVALRDIINGSLEGGSGSDSNIKANGITARELADALLLRGLPSRGVVQEGVTDSGDGKVTPGAGLVLNFASGVAWVLDDSLGLAAGALVPVVFAGSTVTIGANASGNPRIDQIILTVTGYGTGTVSVLAGTATAGATLDNRNGATVLPGNAVRLADILMPNGFAGPFIQTTHIRDRRPWARGAYNEVLRTAGDLTTASGVAASLSAADLDKRIEVGGTSVRYAISFALTSSAVTTTMGFDLFVDGAAFERRFATVDAAGGGIPVDIDIEVPGLTPGSHTFSTQWFRNAGAGTLTANANGTSGLVQTITEMTRGSAENSGA